MQVHADNEAAMHDNNAISGLAYNNANSISSPAGGASSASPSLLGTAKEVDYLAKMVGVRRRPEQNDNNSSQEGEERIEISMFDDETEQM